MCSPHKVVEERFVGRREVLCSSNDAFDHMVIAGSRRKILSMAPHPRVATPSG